MRKTKNNLFQNFEYVLPDSSSSQNFILFLAMQKLSNDLYTKVMLLVLLGIVKIRTIISILEK